MQNYSITNHDLKFLPENVLLWSIDNQLCPTLSILEFFISHYISETTQTSPEVDLDAHRHHAQGAAGNLADPRTQTANVHRGDRGVKVTNRLEAFSFCFSHGNQSPQTVQCAFARDVRSRLILVQLWWQPEPCIPYKILYATSHVTQNIGLHP